MKLLDNYNQCLGTLSQVSKDKANNVSMIEDISIEHRLINFDGIKKKICKGYRGEALASCDGMIIHNGIRYLIEFKNQSEDNIDKAKIKNKAFDSLTLIALNENITREQIAQDTVFIIVYNNEEYVEGPASYCPSEAIDNFTKKLKKWSKKKGLEQYPRKFDTSIYVNKFYKQVYTIDVSVFKREFMKLLFDK